MSTVPGRMPGSPIVLGRLNPAKCRAGRGSPRRPVPDRPAPGWPAGTPVPPDPSRIAAHTHSCHRESLPLCGTSSLTATGERDRQANCEQSRAEPDRPPHIGTGVGSSDAVTATGAARDGRDGGDAGAWPLGCGFGCDGCGAGLDGPGVVGSGSVATVIVTVATLDVQLAPLSPVRMQYVNRVKRRRTPVPVG